MSTRWEMPGQVFPPESFGPCTIAGEKFAAVRKARVAPASETYAEDIRSTEMKTLLRAERLGCGDPADSGIAVRWVLGRLTAARLPEFRKVTLVTPRHNDVTLL